MIELCVIYLWVNWYPYDSIFQDIIVEHMELTKHTFEFEFNNSAKHTSGKNR